MLSEGISRHSVPFCFCRTLGRTGNRSSKRTVESLFSAKSLTPSGHYELPGVRHKKGRASPEPSADGMKLPPIKSNGKGQVDSTLPSPSISSNIAAILAGSGAGSMAVLHSVTSLNLTGEPGLVKQGTDVSMKNSIQSIRRLVDQWLRVVPLPCLEKGRRTVPRPPLSSSGCRWRC